MKLPGHHAMANRQLPHKQASPTMIATAAAAQKRQDNVYMHPQDVGWHPSKHNHAAAALHHLKGAAGKVSVHAAQVSGLKSSMLGASGSVPMPGSLPGRVFGRPKVPIPAPAQPTAFPSQVVSTPAKVDDKTFNAMLIGRIEQVKAGALGQLNALQTFGHRLSQPEIVQIVRILTEAANQVQAMAAAASRSPQLSMDSVGHVQAATQDMYKAAMMYMNMLEGQAMLDNQTQLAQMRNNLANAQQLYSAFANDSMRRVSSLNPNANAAGYGPVMPGMPMMPMPMGGTPMTSMSMPMGTMGTMGMGNMGTMGTMGTMTPTPTVPSGPPTSTSFLPTGPGSFPEAEDETNSLASENATITPPPMAPLPMPPLHHRQLPVPGRKK